MIIRKSKILFLIFYLFVVSCSINRGFDKRQLLKEEILRWKNFSIDGVAEINYKSFRFRKDIQIRKNKSTLRITLFNSGIFGLSPSPFFDLFADTSNVSIKFMDKKAENSHLKKNLNIFEYLNLEIPQKNILEILSSGQTDFKNLKFYFNQKMRISKINSDRYKTEIDFSYDGEKINFIKIIKNNKSVVNIRIDKFST